MYDIDRIKAPATHKWVDAVNNWGELGLWDYSIVEEVTKIRDVLEQYSGLRV
ncbi:MAG: hypothetical protein U5R49_21515 [Deltaproteobacteria bacterium]|nr:hypothetical protein [Deltaproteobacteria bacterium]